MPDEDGFLGAIKANPEDDLPRLVYADWLDERDDARGDFLRLHLALKAVGPDHIDRVSGEEELSVLRKGCDPTWLAVVEPSRSPSGDRLGRYWCGCYEAKYHREGKYHCFKQSTPDFHVETQDTECDVWKRLLDLVEKAATDRREVFAPFWEFNPSDLPQILTLPPTITKLKVVKTLNLNRRHPGAGLVRLPAEIGEMTSLETITSYCSDGLHWFPYELTRCQNLRKSEVVIHPLYGNVDDRPPFPRLDTEATTSDGGVEPTRLHLKRRPRKVTRSCSVCARQFEDLRLHRVWVSVQIADSVLPLLVNACSEGCVSRLPKPPDEYVQFPHKGGHNVKQPPPLLWREES